MDRYRDGLAKLREDVSSQLKEIEEKRIRPLEEIKWKVVGVVSIVMFLIMLFQPVIHKMIK